MDCCAVCGDQVDFQTNHVWLTTHRVGSESAHSDEYILHDGCYEDLSNEWAEARVPSGQ